MGLRSRARGAPLITHMFEQFLTFFLQKGCLLILVVRKDIEIVFMGNNTSSRLNFICKSAFFKKVPKLHELVWRMQFELFEKHRKENKF